MEDDEEFMEGMIAIAVPIMDVHGRVISALLFHTPIYLLNHQNAGAHLVQLKAGAKDLEQLLV